MCIAGGSVPTDSESASHSSAMGLIRTDDDPYQLHRSHTLSGHYQGMFTALYEVTGPYFQCLVLLCYVDNRFLRSIRTDTRLSEPDAHRITMEWFHTLSEHLQGMCQA